MHTLLHHALVHGHALDLSHDCRILGQSLVHIGSILIKGILSSLFTDRLVILHLARLFLGLVLLSEMALLLAPRQSLGRANSLDSHESKPAIFIIELRNELLEDMDEPLLGLLNVLHLLLVVDVVSVQYLLLAFLQLIL